MEDAHSGPYVLDLRHQFLHLFFTLKHGQTVFRPTSCSVDIALKRKACSNY
jgi:hypothetical protein